MQHAAAFYALAFVFTSVENTSKEESEAAIDEQFHGTTSAPLLSEDRNGNKQGTVYQLVDGNSACAALYNFEADRMIGSSKELVLKTCFCRQDETSYQYVAGTHFTSKMISKFGLKKSLRVSGRTL
jgi:hypothetical protein